MKPNIIYNKTTLKPGEGTLYTAITTHTDLTFTYTFTSTPNPTNKTTNHQINIELESPDKWTKTLTTTEKQEILQLTDALNFTLQINGTKIKQLTDKIDEETGTRTTNYNINIRPTIHTTAEIPAGTIDEPFNPTITVAFKYGTTEGNYISIENLQQTKTGTKTETTQIHHQEIVNTRLASIIATVATISVLAVTTWFYTKAKPTKPTKKPIKDIITPYKEIIAETTEKPPETTQTITMETLEDLTKIAENLVKPILHTKEPETKGQTTHTFYILDNNTKYQYITTEEPPSEE